MNVLWVCNNILPDFADEFGVNWNFGAGWATGLLHAFFYVPEYKIGLCFPIIDEERMKNAEHMGCKYYSFHMSMNYREYDDSMKNEFKEIIEDFQPDIVHIWGTERNHARAALDACCELGLGNHVLVYIQGIASLMSLHYATGVPQSVIEEKNNDDIVEIREEINQFHRWGLSEEHVFQKAKYATGRTEWDKAYVKAVNQDVNYLPCNEILRDAFYTCSEFWTIKRCKKFTIFVSQAHYPLKGLHFLIKAMPMILKKYPDTKVRIGGVNPTVPNKKGKVPIYGKYLNHLFQEYGLADKFHFLGTLRENDMVMEYLNANVYVLPSTIDNSPNSIAEAMMLGTPTVASYVGGVPSIVEHGKTGFLYPFDEYYMLAHYITRLFEDDVLAEKISKEERAVAKKRHDAIATCNRMKEIYQQIAFDMG